jgi:rRNA maturation endonuclease Nob1
MGKGTLNLHERQRGRCIACIRRFVGPGQHCPPCAQKARAKAAEATDRKRRRRR